MNRDVFSRYQRSRTERVYDDREKAVNILLVINYAAYRALVSLIKSEQSCLIAVIRVSTFSRCTCFYVRRW